MRMCELRRHAIKEERHPDMTNLVHQNGAANAHCAVRKRHQQSDKVRPRNDGTYHDYDGRMRGPSCSEPA